eukprot:g19544.t1
MCPLRFIFVLLAALGLMKYVSPMASEQKEGRSSTMTRAFAVYGAAGLILALHADLLLSLGYTKCAVEAFAGFHQRHLTER